MRIKDPPLSVRGSREVRHRFSPSSSSLSPPLPSLPLSSRKPTKPTEVCIHGVVSSSNRNHIQSEKAQILKKKGGGERGKNEMRSPRRIQMQRKDCIAVSGTKLCGRAAEESSPSPSLLELQVLKRTTTTRSGWMNMHSWTNDTLVFVPTDRRWKSRSHQW